MAKYRKKPIVINAFQWNGNLTAEEKTFPDWFKFTLKSGGIAFEYAGSSESIISIDTLEGTMRAEPTDWIIQGVKGEIYPCKNDIFLATYEKVEE